MSHTCIIIKSSYEGICVEFERKNTTQNCVSIFQIVRKYYMFLSLTQ